MISFLKRLLRPARQRFEIPPEEMWRFSGAHLRAEIQERSEAALKQFNEFRDKTLSERRNESI